MWTPHELAAAQKQHFFTGFYEQILGHKTALKPETEASVNSTATYG